MREHLTPLSTQPSPQGFALQLELRPSPPVGERDQNEESSVARVFSSLSPAAGERAG
jgi:hypothetical protein